MHVWTRAALVTSLALASTAMAGSSFRVYGYGAPWVAPYPVPYGYAYPVVPGYGWQPPLPYGVPYQPAPGWYGYDPDYVYRMQPGFQFREPEGRRGFSIEGFTLPGGR